MTCLVKLVEVVDIVLIVVDLEFKMTLEKHHRLRDNFCVLLHERLELPLIALGAEKTLKARFHRYFAVSEPSVEVKFAVCNSSKNHFRAFVLNQRGLAQNSMLLVLAETFTSVLGSFREIPGSFCRFFL